jgi:hypothetical protein
MRRLTLAQAIIKETEDLLEKWKHPDPYRAPTAPGGTVPPLEREAVEMLIVILGSKYERNLPAPILDREFSASYFLKHCIDHFQLLYGTRTPSPSGTTKQSNERDDAAGVYLSHVAGPDNSALERMKSQPFPMHLIYHFRSIL